MAGIPFVKMHGLGNDFVIVDLRPAVPALTAEQVRRLCHRHLGVGCDQFITLEPPQAPEATAVMGIWNPDGSRAGACGNATRCVAFLLMEETGQDRCVVETVAGLLPAWRAENGLIGVDMGPARFDWQQIPLAEAQDTAHLALTVGPLHDPVAVSMGNPHTVFFVEDVAAIPLEQIGRTVEHHALFPERTNVEAVQVLARDRLRMRVWERGAGMTAACGSGACAVMAAAVRRGLADARAEVILDGGSLWMDWRAEDGHVLMTGPVATVFTGLLGEGILESGV